MRFTTAIAALVVMLAPSVFAQEDTTVLESSTTTVTRTVIQATATSTIVRSANPSSSAARTSGTSIARAATPTESTLPSETMGAGTKEQSGLFVVVVAAGAAVIALGL